MEIVLWGAFFLAIIGWNVVAIIGLVRYLRRPGRHYEPRQEDESGSA
jgi:hypothetical protein